MKYKLEPDDLIAHGFTEYEKRSYDNFSRVWSFWVRDKTGKKLSVHVRLWEHNYGPCHSDTHRAFDAFCQFDMRKQNTFNVELLCVSDMTPAEIVAWFCDVHEKLGCSYYEKFIEDS